MEEFKKLKLKKVIKNGTEILVPADQLTTLICDISQISIPAPAEFESLKARGFEIVIKQS
jgi:hypothetical protein